MKLKKEESARRFAFIEDAISAETDECIDWPYAMSNGERSSYPTLHSKEGKRYVTRIVCERAHGPPKQLADAAHNCGNMRCINKRHLRWDTRRGNMADQILHGTRARGESCGASKLTEKQVREIRGMAGTASHSAIADQFGVVPDTVRFIINRTTWSWLP